MKISVSVNGQSHIVPVDSSLAEICAFIGIRTNGIALGVNGVVIPCDCWATYKLSETAEISIFQAIAGG